MGLGGSGEKHRKKKNPVPAEKDEGESNIVTTSFGRIRHTKESLVGRTEGSMEEKKILHSKP